MAKSLAQQVDHVILTKWSHGQFFDGTYQAMLTMVMIM